MQFSNKTVSLGLLALGVVGLVAWHIPIVYSQVTSAPASTSSVVTAPTDPALDSDGDTVPDLQETTIYKTNPQQTDTDGDGFSDSAEIKDGFSPLVGDKKLLRQIDSDNDGLWDDWEIALGSDILNSDTDGDLFSDGSEVLYGYSPTSSSNIKQAKRIAVTIKTQQLAYYFGDKKLDQFAISSGLPGTPTPIGNFTVLKKRPIVDYIGSDYRYLGTKWNLMFKRGSWGNYYVHGAYWHNQFGRVRSHGCVNVPQKMEYMGRLYDWAEEGTPVTISAS